jgi:hypothetical protein
VVNTYLGGADMAQVTALAPVSNDGESTIDLSQPYTVSVEIEGTADLLFHRWSVEGVEAKAKAAKGSAAKKTDDIESYVYRHPEDGTISIPGAYLRGSIAGPQGAAKFRQDPRSPRKSALDLYKAGVQSLTPFASLGVKEWDYLDRQRVTVQRNGITRVRPAMHKGWKATFDLLVTIPEYISPHDLHDVLVNAGRLVGLGDFRPTFGRFNVTHFEVR